MIPQNIKGKKKTLIFPELNARPFVGLMQSPLTHLRIAEIHLRVLFLELLQNIRLLLLIARRQSLLLLSLVKHHLLNHTPCLPIQIRKLGVLRRYLRNVDLGCAGDDVRPPFHLIRLVDVDLYRLCAVGVGCKSPG